MYVGVGIWRFVKKEGKKELCRSSFVKSEVFLWNLAGFCVCVCVGDMDWIWIWICKRDGKIGNGMGKVGIGNRE